MCNQSRNAECIHSKRFDKILLKSEQLWKWTGERWKLWQQSKIHHFIKLYLGETRKTLKFRLFTYQTTWRNLQKSLYRLSVGALSIWVGDADWFKLITKWIRQSETLKSTFFYYLISRTSSAKYSLMYIYLLLWIFIHSSVTSCASRSHFGNYIFTDSSSALKHPSTYGF